MRVWPVNEMARVTRVTRVGGDAMPALLIDARV